jgi:hypothetical protein
LREYKPIFRRDATSPTDDSRRMAYSYDIDMRGTLSIAPDSLISQPITDDPHLYLGETARPEIGPIVFYSGAAFCTDLSGDRGFLTRTHSSNSSSSRSQQSIPLGLPPSSRRQRQRLQRIESSEEIRLRPFKDYSRAADLMEGKFPLDPSTPSLSSKDSKTDYIDFSALEAAEPTSTVPAVDDEAFAPAPLELPACGLGMTQPADHFIVVVETSHPRYGSKFHKDLQEQLAQTMDPERRTARLLHLMSERRIGDGKGRGRDKGKGKEKAVEVHQWSSPAPLRGSSPSVMAGNSRGMAHFEMEVAEVKVSVLSERWSELEPSELPPPATLPADLDSEESDSEGFAYEGEDEEEDERVRRLARERHVPLVEEEDSDGDGDRSNDQDEEDENSEDEDMDDGDDESDTSEDED